MAAFPLVLAELDENEPLGWSLGIWNGPKDAATW